MKGTVIQYDPQTHNGFILANDDNRYKFDQIDWKELKKKPKEGMVITFDVDAEDEQKAIEIIPVPPKGGAGLPIGTFLLGFLAFLTGVTVAEEPDHLILTPLAFTIVPIVLGSYGLWKKQENKKGWMIMGMVMGLLGSLFILE